MKKELSPKGIAAALGVLVIAIAVAAFLYFKPQIGAGPPVSPIPYGGAAGGQGKYVEEDDVVRPGGGGAPGAPIGAPASGG
jgi:hypothetical protein